MATGFHRRKGSSDGLQGICKVCTNAHSVARNKQPHVKIAASAARTIRRKKPDVIAKRAAYHVEYSRRLEVISGRAARSKLMHGGVYARRSKAYSERNPHKRMAGSKVSNAVRDGKMPRASGLPCDDADSTCFGAHQYHHDSYLERDWLNVRALCRSHHKRWHRDNEATPYECE